MPKGRILAICPFESHHDPGLYPDPEAFNPDRPPLTLGDGTAVVPGLAGGWGPAAWAWTPPPIRIVVFRASFVCFGSWTALGLGEGEKRGSDRPAATTTPARALTRWPLPGAAIAGRRHGGGGRPGGWVLAGSGAQGPPDPYRGFMQGSCVLALGWRLAYGWQTARRCDGGARPGGWMLARKGARALSTMARVMLSGFLVGAWPGGGGGGRGRGR